MDFSYLFNDVIHFNKCGSCIKILSLIIIFHSIYNKKIAMHSTELLIFLFKLLEKDSTKRLGNRFCPHGDIQDHAFFKPIDWPALEARALEAPFKPNLVGKFYIILDYN